MNPIAEEIMSYLEPNDSDIQHYGMPRRSGRYPWGSGDDPYQRTGDFLSRIDELKKSGLSEPKIAEALGMSTGELRDYKATANDIRWLHESARAHALREKGYNNSEIGRMMGKNESTIRGLFNEETEANRRKAMKTADSLKKLVNEKGMLDVGAYTELELGISSTKLSQALTICEAEGYPVYGGRMDQATNKGQKTTLKVLCPPGTEHHEIYQFDKIHSINEYISKDGGQTIEKKFTYPASLDSKRLKIRYNEEGGVDKDGVIELRRGVDDLSLGNSHYAQVRILVDGTHYLKGMAIYSDNMPDGVDVIFNTNKKKGTSMQDTLKEIKKDPDNPFGSLIKDADQGGQYWYVDKNTGEKKLGLINKRADEGDWSDWKDKLPSQFLSKQSLHLANQQLNQAISDKQAEYDSIMSINNPTIRKYYLKDFAEGCDKSAVTLQAAALPGQKYHVIIPVNTLKDNEVYAPKYEDGTKLALIRYPHGGPFEIPILTVNNKNKQAKEILGKDSSDAVAINKSNADRLSGADFDGDTVMCIPTHNGKVKITSTKRLKGLENFEGKDEYGADDVVVDKDGTKHYYQNGREYPLMKKGQQTQTQMGVISNLISDMYLRGANEDEMAAAVRHSMVVIDAAKHHLNYKKSEIDNNISALKKKYQDGGGASTLISKAKKEVDVDKRQGTPRINQKGKEWYDPTKPEGSLIYKTSDNVEYNVAKVYKRSNETPNSTVRVSEKGKRYIQLDGSDIWTPIDGKSDIPEGTRIYANIITKRQKQKSTYMAETDDAFDLVSKTNSPMERAYARYANTMKDMANKARIEYNNTGRIAYSPTANKAYKAEVDSLEAKLKNSLTNKPKERMANALAISEVKAKKESNPDMTHDEEKKASQQALTKYRDRLGARRTLVEVTDREWEAIQAGAIRDNMLKDILANADKDALRDKATPRSSKGLNKSQINRIKALSANGYSLAEISKKMGISPSSVSDYLKGVN